MALVVERLAVAEDEHRHPVTILPAYYYVCAGGNGCEHEELAV